MAKQKYWNGTDWVQVAPSMEEFTNGAVFYAEDTGIADFKKLSIPVITAYKKGLAVSFVNKIANASANVYIDINSLANVPILNSKGLQLKAGDLKAGIPYTFRHNGTSFILQGEGGEDLTSLAQTLGYPSSTTSELTQLVSDLQARKNALASNLTAKGQSSGGTEGLDALINKIPNIVMGSSKGASGRKAMNRGLVFGSAYYSLDVSGLDFLPKHVMVQWIGGNAPVRSQSLVAPINHVKIDLLNTPYYNRFQIESTTSAQGSFSTSIFIEMASYSQVGVVLEFNWWAWN